MKRALVALVCFLFAGACARIVRAGDPAATGAAAYQVDDYVAAQLREQRIPGLALGVYRNGEIVKAQGYGLANIELNVPVKPETIFQSGSVGKQFTATAVMMLVEEGKVGLDDPITKYFKDAPPSWNQVTVRHLLSHTAGFTDYPEKFDFRQDRTEDDLLKVVEGIPLAFPPGTKFSYSNLGYLTLGILIHRATGQFYGDILRERIFQPLGMTSTRIISEADIIPNRAAGYRLVKNELKNQEWVSPAMNTTADGSLYFNVLDLAKWDAALYTEKLVKKSSLDQMWTVAKLNNGEPNAGHYGFAWDVNQMNAHRAIEHGGAWQGFTTYIARYLDDKLTVVVLANLDSAHANAGKIAHHVAGLYIPELMPAVLNPIEDKEPRVTAFFRETLERIAAGRANPEDFAPALRNELFPTRIQASSEYLKSLGPLKSLDLVERKEEEGQPAYTYRAVFGDQTLLLHFNLTTDGKIASWRRTSEE